MAPSLWRTLFGDGWREVEASERRWQVAAAIALVVTVIVVTSCASNPTDVAEVEGKPLLERCPMEKVAEPQWALDMVQLTGNALQDVVLLWRAAEAEIEQRIAYESKLRAAIAACA